MESADAHWTIQEAIEAAIQASHPSQAVPSGAWDLPWAMGNPHGKIEKVVKHHGKSWENDRKSWENHGTS